MQHKMPFWYLTTAALSTFYVVNKSTTGSERPQSKVAETWSRKDGSASLRLNIKVPDIYTDSLVRTSCDIRSIDLRPSWVPHPLPCHKDLGFGFLVEF
jgi:hypothetical protein